MAPGYFKHSSVSISDLGLLSIPGITEADRLSNYSLHKENQCMTSSELTISQNLVCNRVRLCSPTLRADSTLVLSHTLGKPLAHNNLLAQLSSQSSRFQHPQKQLQ